MTCWSPKLARCELMAIQGTTAFNVTEAIMKELCDKAGGQRKHGQAPRGKLERRIQKWVDSLGGKGGGKGQNLEEDLMAAMDDEYPSSETHLRTVGIDKSAPYVNFWLLLMKQACRMLCDTIIPILLTTTTNIATVVFTTTAAVAYKQTQHLLAPLQGTGLSKNYCARLLLRMRDKNA